MKVRVVALLAALALVVGGSSAWAQSQTGEIFGKVTDASGAVLPGVTVTLTGPSLLQPQVAATSESGTFQFPRLNVGTYNVKFELPGFKTVIKEGIQVTVDFSANVSTQLSVSSVQETVTVTGESPIVDTKQTGTKQTFTLEQLQQHSVGARSVGHPAADRGHRHGPREHRRQHVGPAVQLRVARRATRPTTSGRSTASTSTDMAATGASPTYYDFDAFQEMTISTGGVDVTQQTGGVGINLVTKSGSDKFKGSGRFYDTNDRFESNNITTAMRAQGATSGNPIQDIKDYGFEAGGPIKKGKAWIWGSYGKQDIKVGVIGFYKPDAELPGDQGRRRSASASRTTTSA